MITLELMIATHSTNSPTEKLRLLILDNDLSLEEKDVLSKFFQKQIDNKKEQGFLFSKKRIYNKKKLSKTYNFPKFFPDYKGGGKCSTCNEIINSHNAFRHKVNNSYKNYHAIVDCFPEDYREIMLLDKDYLKFLRGENEEKH